MFGQRIDRSALDIWPTAYYLALTALLVLAGCSARHAAIPGEALASRSATPTEQTESPPYLIQPGDELDIKFFFNPELNENALVRPDGKISLQLVDEVRAAGLSPSNLDALLTEAYAGELREPAITVIVRALVRQVYVGGEVKRPGVVNLGGDMTPLQAIISAGGFRETASPANILLIRKALEEEPITYRIDLEDALYAGAVEDGFELQPRDIIYVPKTRIARAGQFARLYIRDVLQFGGFSLFFGLN